MLCDEGDRQLAERLFNLRFLPSENPELHDASQGCVLLTLLSQAQSALHWFQQACITARHWSLRLHHKLILGTSPADKDSSKNKALKAKNSVKKSTWKKTRKPKYSTIFHRPKTLKRDRQPKYPRIRSAHPLIQHPDVLTPDGTYTAVTACDHGMGSFTASPRHPA